MAAIGLAVDVTTSGVHRIATTLLPAVQFSMFAFVFGAALLTIYGLPVAFAAAVAMQRVRYEILHLAVFGLLGALGSPVLALWFGGGNVALNTLALMLLFGVVTAVVARFGAKRWALSLRPDDPKARSTIVRRRTTTAPDTGYDGASRSPGAAGTGM